MKCFGHESFEAFLNDQKKGKDMQDHTPYQQKIIKRYYENYDSIGRQRLAELVTDIYLAEGKKLAACWRRAEEVMRKMKIPEAQIRHIVDTGDPANLASLVKQLG